MPRRLAHRSAELPIWIAFAVALILFAIAMALAWWRMGSYDAAAAPVDARAPSIVAVLHR